MQFDTSSHSANAFICLCHTDKLFDSSVGR